MGAKALQDLLDSAPPTTDPEELRIMRACRYELDRHAIVKWIKTAVALVFIVGVGLIQMLYAVGYTIFLTFTIPPLLVVEILSWGKLRPVMWFYERKLR
jgi:hypothetical protein